jgi:hypothetical protein
MDLGILLNKILLIEISCSNIYFLNILLKNLKKIVKNMEVCKTNTHNYLFTFLEFFERNIRKNFFERFASINKILWKTNSKIIRFLAYEFR